MTAPSKTEPRIGAVDLAALMYEAQFVSPGSDPAAREAMRRLSYRLAGELFPIKSSKAEDVELQELRRARFISLCGYRLPDPLAHLRSKCYLPSGPGDVRRTVRRDLGGEL